MVGISVIQPEGWDANLVEVGPSTKLTVCGAVPWAIRLSGASRPVVKIGTILS